MRIDSPENIRAVRESVRLPILDVYKVISDSCDVYITPTFAAAKQIVEAGSNIIAVGATRRCAPAVKNLKKLSSVFAPNWGSR